MADRKLIVKIAGDSSSLERAFRRSSDAAAGFNRRLGGALGSLARGALFAGGAAAVGGLAAVIHEGTAEFVEHSKVAAQTAAALKSTGEVAGVSAKQIESLALSLSNLSGIDDEVVQAGENVLLAFTNIRDAAGEGNDIFTQATKAAVDFAARTGRDVPQAALLFGKALEDPAKRLTSLARAGVVFSAAQIKQVTALQKSGHLMEAQQLILKELEKRYGGAAAAAGGTLPGKLKILRERFRDLSGELVGAFAPALTTAVGGITKFVQKLSQAKGFKAKLKIVWEGIQSVARSLFDLIGRAVSALTVNLRAKLNVLWEGAENAAKGAASILGDVVSKIDWNEVWANAKGIADGLQKRLAEIDFSAVGTRIGDAFAQAVKVAVPAAKELAKRISDVVGEIDFVKLGKALGPGLAAAIVTAFVTLTDPAFWAKNWDLALAVGLSVGGGRILRIFGKLAGPLARLGGDLVLKLVEPFQRFGPRVASVILEGLIRLPGIVSRALAPLTGLVSRVFGRLGKVAQFVVKVLGIQVVIDAVVGLAQKIGQVFGRLGGFIGGVLDRAWDAIKKKALQAAVDIIEPFTHIPKKLGGGTFQDLQKKWQATLDAMNSKTKTATDGIQKSIDGIHGKTVEITVKAPPGLQGPVGGPDVRPPGGIVRGPTTAKPPAPTTTKPPPKPTPTTPAPTPVPTEPKWLKQARLILDQLQLGSQRAALTKTFKDDIAAQEKIVAFLTKQVALHKNNLELQQQRVSAQQALNGLLEQQQQVEKDARTARQFKALGLGPTGDAIIPGVGNLKKQSASLLARLQASGGLTTKLKALFAGVGKVLSGSLGKVTGDTRAKIAELFQTIRQGFDQGASKLGPLTKTHALNTNAIVAGLGLDPDAIRELRGRLSKFNTAGVALGGGPRLAGAGAGGAIVVESHTTINLDSQKVADAVTRQQQRKDARNPRQKRGPNRR